MCVVGGAALCVTMGMSGKVPGGIAVEAAGQVMADVVGNVDVHRVSGQSDECQHHLAHEDRASEYGANDENRSEHWSPPTSRGVQDYFAGYAWFCR